MSRWSIKKANELYNIQNWGNRFFEVLSNGNIGVDPKKNGHVLDLKKLIDDLIENKGLQLPILIRFSNILQKRLSKINDCFEKSFKTHQYNGKYFGVYPIKVNQQRQVVEEIIHFGKDYNVGLEVGSKPELHATIAMMDNPKALIICNGSKDESFIRLALYGQKLKHQIIIVVEKLSELALIAKISAKVNIKPRIGLRVRLATRGNGKWLLSGGEQSKFGLTAAEIVQAIDTAKQLKIEDSIELLHFHLGSQIPNIHNIKEALKEIAYFYNELCSIGLDIKYVDVGGGLGVDYDGSRSTLASSINYSIEEYANDVVYYIKQVCEQKNLKHPHIITESGRALTAHHSVMVFNVLETSSHSRYNIKLKAESTDNDIITQLLAIYKNLDSNNFKLQYWHDAIKLKEQSLNQFRLGLTSLQQRAKAEILYWTIATYFDEHYKNKSKIPQEILELKAILAYKYYCNFSVFQSIPDSWAIGQIFPIAPLQRLNEEPLLNATIQDLTCDSDGKVDHFINKHTTNNVLKVHPIKKDENYYIGVFLVGAYQEILGDLHNLYGDTNTVHVSIDNKGKWNIEQIIKGDSVGDVLGYVQFGQDKLLEQLSRTIGICLGRGDINKTEADYLTEIYREGLGLYTYMS